MEGGRVMRTPMVGPAFDLTTPGWPFNPGGGHTVSSDMARTVAARRDGSLEGEPTSVKNHIVMLAYQGIFFGEGPEPCAWTLPADTAMRWCTRRARWARREFVPALRLIGEVRTFTVKGCIESVNFILVVDADRRDFVDQPEHAIGEQECPCRRNQHSRKLFQEKAHVTHE